jgi:alkanesulfonate monooxygenase SsuD/methylene tetrahydromethanopterin reductase-like flavin-dependent oxidoreductase (luciferase family)
MLEALTTLGHLAAQTSPVRLGTMVASATLRPAALLVKSVTTVDVLSGGRAWFGIGAGYLQAEADDLGVALPAIGERFAALEDVLQLALRMWSGDDSALDGHRIHARRPIGFPAPSTTPPSSAGRAKGGRCDWWRAPPMPATCPTSATAAR